MKRTLFAIFFLLIFKVNGQFKEGVVYFKNGDIIKGFIKKSSSLKIVFKEDLKSKGIKLNHSKIIGFDILNDKYRYKYLNQSKSRKVLGFDSATGKMIYDKDKNEENTNNPTLLRLIIEGNINLYGEDFSGGGFAIPGGFGATFGGGSTTDYYIEKYKNIFKIGNRIGNENLKYFNDCISLKDKILNKEIDKNDIIGIVFFYNTKCDE